MSTVAPFLTASLRTLAPENQAERALRPVTEASCDVHKTEIFEAHLGRAHGDVCLFPYLQLIMTCNKKCAVRHGSGMVLTVMGVTGVNYE